MADDAREIFSREIMEKETAELRVNIAQEVYDNAWKIALAELEIDRREKLDANAKEERQTFKDDIETIWGALVDMRGQLFRMLILGNAGGTIATLSFMGTMVGKSTDLSYDARVFPVLLIFVAGLASGVVYRLSEYGQATWMHIGIDRDSKIYDSIPLPMVVTSSVTLLICAVCLAKGSWDGLWILKAMGK